MNRQEIITRISTEYSAGGYGLGWRLLMGPAQTLQSARIAFLGLNPGGSNVDTAHGEFSVEAGSAYVVESWGDHPPGESPLQQQARALFAMLSVEPVDVLAGNLIPFRSQSFRTLPNRNRAMAFGKSLWREILNSIEPEIVITMSADVTKVVANLLDAESPHRIPVGWGSVTGMRSNFEMGTLIGLPHLSRYRIFGRDKSAAALDELFNGLSKSN